jgi:hypothetical protein
MCGVCMEISVHKLSDGWTESVWTHLYTSYQNDVCSLYGNISSQGIFLMFGVFMEIYVVYLSDWFMESLENICTPVFIMIYGVCVEISGQKLSYWCVESVWRYLYTNYHTDVWSMYGDICTQDIRLTCGVCMETSVHLLSDWCVESLWTHL